MKLLKRKALLQTKKTSKKNTKKMAKILKAQKKYLKSYIKHLNARLAKSGLTADQTNKLKENLQYFNSHLLKIDQDLKTVNTK